MADDDEIRRVAAEHVRHRGAGAVAWLTEQAEIAEAIGDTEAAKAWREIAAAAEGLLQSN